jgi:hypothetical protein
MSMNIYHYHNHLHNKIIMKLPRSLKLPRKLKKELKKGFTRNIHPSFPTIKESNNPLTGSFSCSIYQNISYSGSNTKSFFRLCKFARKEERLTMKKMMDMNMQNMKLRMHCFDPNIHDSYIIGFDPAIGFSQSITGPIDPLHASLIALYPKINI